MGLQLLPELSFCLVEDRVIFLDLASDRYFRLQSADERVFVELVNGSEDLSPSDLPAGFPVRRLFRHVSKPARPCPAIAPACRQAFLPDPTTRPSVIQVTEALFGQLRASRRVRNQRFLTLVEQLRSMSNNRHQNVRVDEIVQAHALTDLIYSAHDRCLAKSIALFAALRRSAIDGRLIFGVTARPFAAHCWVQVDDMVLNGDIDLIHLFTPIMII
jgi:hypothetical protein